MFATVLSRNYNDFLKEKLGAAYESFTKNVRRGYLKVIKLRNNKETTKRKSNFYLKLNYSFAKINVSKKCCLVLKRNYFPVIFNIF